MPPEAAPGALQGAGAARKPQASQADGTSELPRRAQAAPCGAGGRGVILPCHRAEACPLQAPQAAQGECRMETGIRRDVDSASRRRDCYFPKTLMICQPTGLTASSGALVCLFCSPSHNHSPTPTLARRVSTHLPAHLLSLPLRLRLPFSARGQPHLSYSSLALGPKTTMPLLRQEAQHQVNAHSQRGGWGPQASTCLAPSLPTPHFFICTTPQLVNLSKTGEVRFRAVKRWAPHPSASSGRI